MELLAHMLEQVATPEAAGKTGTTIRCLPEVEETPPIGNKNNLPSDWWELCGRLQIYQPDVGRHTSAATCSILHETAMGRPKGRCKNRI
jgi:hypothetical protein